MNSILGTRLLITACCVLGAAAIAGVVRVHRLQDQLATTSLDYINLKATQDTTRQLLGAAEEALQSEYGDSSHGVTKLAEQVPIAVDKLAKALKQQTVANVTLKAQVDSLVALVNSVAGVTSDSADNVRRATFNVRQVPYTVEADVALPRAPLPGTMNVTVTSDPAPIDVRVACGPKDHGVRTASVDVITPNWLNVNVTKAKQDPRLCNEQQPGRIKFGVGVGYAYLLDGHRGPALVASLNYQP